MHTADAFRQLTALTRLPRRVASFYLRALATAVRTGDRWSLRAAARPRELAAVLRLARDRRSVVELGTGTGWMALALALADPQRTVTTFDPRLRAGRDRYLALVPQDVRARIAFREEPGEVGPEPGRPADFVFVDSQHEHDATVEAFTLWEPAVEPGGLIVFHDYGNPRWPGVAEAVATLGLQGRIEPLLFVWQKAGSRPG